MTSESLIPREQDYQLPWGSRSFQGPHLVTGEGLRGQKPEQEAQTIHEENIARLQAMTPEEILQEQQRLLAQLGMGTYLSYRDQAGKGLPLTEEGLL